jgi:SAM-dependent methyltransferase
LANYYDQLTEDVDYPDLYRYLMDHFQRGGVQLHRLLDVGCGTGSLAMLFAAGGVRTLGMDLSADMLARAQEKAEMPNAPCFLQGNMADFHLSQPVDGLTCMLDSFNYLSAPADGAAALQCFYDALAPGGMLIFDVRPRRQLMDFDGQIFMDETDDLCCIWRTEFDEEENLCFYGMDIFIRQGDLWRREQEEHYEYAYRLRWLRQRLAQVGFQDIQFYGDRTMTHPEPDAERVFITARKEVSP